jgi:hypothetical protein
MRRDAFHDGIHKQDKTFSTATSTQLFAFIKPVEVAVV